MISAALREHRCARSVARRAAIVVSIVALVAAVAVAAAGAGCRREARDEVVLYVSADEHLARVVVRAFEAETGVRVLLVGDTEAKKTTGLVERLRQERDQPRADVFWSSEIFQTILLAEDGLLASHRSSAADAWPAAYRDPEGRWYAFAARARVIAYSPERVAPQDVPKSWADLSRRTWEGRVAMADPRFGTTGGHLGAMKAYWDAEYGPGIYHAFLLGLRDNGVRLVPSGNAGVVRAIIEGEADVGLTDTDDVWAARALGHSIEMVYPRHAVDDAPGGGTLVIPNTVALVRGAPNPQGGARLVDFLISEKAERMIAESESRNVPLGPDRAKLYPEIAVPDPLRIDFARAAAVYTEAVAEAMRVLSGEEE